MINSIEEYLRQLREELEGCDPATIQDALSDSEEHLRMALHADSDFESVIEKYGTPDVVATAYREAEDRMPPSFAPPAIRRTDGRPFFSRFFGVFAETRVWAALFYFILSLATGIFYFTWVVTGLSVSAGLLVLIVGLPILTLFLLSVRGIAFIEGRLIEALLGVRMPRRSRYAGVATGWIARMKRIFADRTTWTSIIYMIAMLPLGVIYFSLFISLIAVSLELVATPIIELIFDVPFVELLDTDYDISVWFIPLMVIAGVILLTLTMHLTKIVGSAHGRAAKALLVSE